MKKTMLALLFTTLSSSAFAVKFSNITSPAKYSTNGQLQLGCQIVTDGGAILTPAQIAKLQKKDLEVENVTYKDDDGGKTITLHILGDDQVEKVNCLVN